MTSLPPGLADKWQGLRFATPARVALGRSGDAMPTKAQLEFQLASARARDAVHHAVDFDAVAEALAPSPIIRVKSRAKNRATYLKRPDLGRLLDEESAAALTSYDHANTHGEKDWKTAEGRHFQYDMVFIVADGLSADAVTRHAVPVLIACLDLLRRRRVGPVVLAAQARVALADEIGARLGATLTAMLIGERPGLSSPDSLGIYLTYDPRSGRRDSERNCISNIHPAGLSYRDAALKLVWLANEALSRGVTGVELKENAPASLAVTSEPHDLFLIAASDKKEAP